MENGAKFWAGNAFDGMRATEIPNNITSCLCLCLALSKQYVERSVRVCEGIERRRAFVRKYVSIMMIFSQSKQLF